MLLLTLIGLFAQLFGICRAGSCICCAEEDVQLFHINCHCLEDHSCKTCLLKHIRFQMENHLASVTCPCCKFKYDLSLLMTDDEIVVMRREIEQEQALQRQRQDELDALFFVEDVEEEHDDSSNDGAMNDDDWFGLDDRIQELAEDLERREVEDALSQPALLHEFENAQEARASAAPTEEAPTNDATTNTRTNTPSFDEAGIHGFRVARVRTDQNIAFEDRIIPVQNDAGRPMPLNRQAAVYGGPSRTQIPPPPTRGGRHPFAALCACICHDNNIEVEPTPAQLCAYCTRSNECLCLCRNEDEVDDVPPSFTPTEEEENEESRPGRGGDRMQQGDGNTYAALTNMQVNTLPNRTTRRIRQSFMDSWLRPNL